MSRAVARLVAYAEGRSIALAPHTTHEILESPRPTWVPGAAAHALGLLPWRGRRIPLIDVAALVQGGMTDRADACRYALVVAWQEAGEAALSYGALALHALPQMTEVSDVQLCPLPGDSGLWPRLALSCFSHEGQAVPVVDTARLFSATSAGTAR
ncbi:hypothetical protein GCM10027034_18760 [Ramlibacter solisilvae]|uniref:CheW-like domain-containing protein n=1 Tax=Ramlibacter tataouinensis TaxID=94132 RepID=A0A127JVI0_9BURK|nr:chemotaxis protein CheW [Ramlibacter tataouinensis]AMO24007.1 hypothetical protein UC35_15520 [Ramlibacter tataouinensis]